MKPRLTLREVHVDDLPALFDHQRDPAAWHMAAFGAENPSDAQAFLVHWNWVLGNARIVKRSILLEDQLAGYVLSYEEAGRSEVSYWIDPARWRQGVATEALAMFLRELPVRPLFARAAADNLASLRVLQKNGFEVCGAGRGYAEARGCEIDEVLLSLA